MYALTDDEQTHIDDAWKFLEKFKKYFIFVSEYRKYIIEEINKTYTPQQFYQYESILNKLFWNLRWKLLPLWLSPNITPSEYDSYTYPAEFPESLSMCTKQSYNDSADLLKALTQIKLKETYYKSFINKIIIVDEKYIYHKSMEGSSSIFSKNYFNLLTLSILFKRNLYEQVMKDPFVIKNKTTKLPKYFVQFDYGFPNMNTCAYSIGSKDDHMTRIKKMYYNGNDKYWNRVILGTVL